MKHKTYKNSRVLTDSPSVSKREVEFPGGPVVRTPVWFGLVWFGFTPGGQVGTHKAPKAVKKKKSGVGGRRERENLKFKQN